MTWHSVKPFNARHRKRRSSVSCAPRIPPCFDDDLPQGTPSTSCMRQAGWLPLYGSSASPRRGPAHLCSSALTLKGIRASGLGTYLVLSYMRLAYCEHNRYPLQRYSIQKRGFYADAATIVDLLRSRLHSCDVCVVGRGAIQALGLSIHCSSQGGRGIGVRISVAASSVRHHIRTNHVIASISVMFMKGATMSRTKDRLHSFRISRPSEIGLASISRMEHRPRMTGRIATPCCGCSTRPWPRRSSASCAIVGTISWRRG